MTGIERTELRRCKFKLQQPKEEEKKVTTQGRKGGVGRHYEVCNVRLSSLHFRPIIARNKMKEKRDVYGKERKEEAKKKPRRHSPPTMAPLEIHQLNP